MRVHASEALPGDIPTVPFYLFQDTKPLLNHVRPFFIVYQSALFSRSPLGKTFDSMPGGAREKGLSTQERDLGARVARRTRPRACRLFHSVVGMSEVVLSSGKTYTLFGTVHCVYGLASHSLHLYI